MAHWAKINEDSVVENVIVTSNDDADEGESWIAENLGGIWIKTSYNTKKNKHSLGGIPLRKNFAQPGFTYSSELDAFIPPKNENESDFILNTDLGIWVPPISAPADADLVLIYGPEPDLIEKQIEVDNESKTVMVPDLPENPKVYFWIFEESVWGMMPNTTKPEGEFTWDPIAKEWVESSAPSETPAE